MSQWTRASGRSKCFGSVLCAGLWLGAASPASAEAPHLRVHDRAPPSAPKPAPVPAATTARACADVLGAEKARHFAAQCAALSPATHPPCNEGNSCDLIFGELQRSAALAREGASTASTAASKHLATMLALQPNQKEALATFKSARTEFDQRLRAGATAFQRAKPRGGKPGPGAAEALRSAKAEYEAASAAGSTAVQARAGLRGAEDGMIGEVGEAARQAGVAKAMHKAAHDSAAALGSGARELRRVADKEKTPSAIAAASNTEASAAAAERDTTDARNTAASAERDATRARTLTGLGAPEQYARKREQAERDDAKLQAELNKAQNALYVVNRELGTQAPAAGASAAGTTTASGCNLEKTDWANFAFPSASYVVNTQFHSGKATPEQRASLPAFRLGAGAAALSGGRMRFTQADYGDTNGNHTKEAFVTLAFEPSDGHKDNASFVYVFEPDASCALKLLDAVESAVGFTYVEGDVLRDRLPAACGALEEWKLVRGKLKMVNLVNGECGTPGQ